MSLETAHDLLNRSLGQLARKIPGATAIFHRQGLDFCCGGNKSLRRAAEEKIWIVTLLPMHYLVSPAKVMLLQQRICPYHC